jgi:hypothetical protein
MLSKMWSTEFTLVYMQSTCNQTIIFRWHANTHVLLFLSASLRALYNDWQTLCPDIKIVIEQRSPRKDHHLLRTVAVGVQVIFFLIIEIYFLCHPLSQFTMGMANANSTSPTKLSCVYHQLTSVGVSKTISSVNGLISQVGETIRH